MHTVSVSKPFPPAKGPAWPPATSQRPMPAGAGKITAGEWEGRMGIGMECKGVMGRGGEQIRSRRRIGMADVASTISYSPEPESLIQSDPVLLQL